MTKSPDEVLFSRAVETAIVCLIHRDGVAVDRELLQRKHIHTGVTSPAKGLSKKRLWQTKPMFLRSMIIEGHLLFTLYFMPF